jgi:hypothetical protein
MLLKKLQNDGSDGGCIRCPHAEYKCNCWVENYEFSFGKKSRDGSGKCNITFTGSNRNRVYGVLFSIPEDERADLTTAEGANSSLPTGYKIIPDFVVSTEKTNEFPDGKVKAITYIAKGAGTDDKNREPYKWYKDQVIKGAEDYELPPLYIEKIKSEFTSKLDQVETRATREQNYLA